MTANEKILKTVFGTENLDVYFKDKMIECCKQARKEVIEDILSYGSWKRVTILAKEMGIRKELWDK